MANMGTILAAFAVADRSKIKPKINPKMLEIRKHIPKWKIMPEIEPKY